MVGEVSFASGVPEPATWVMMLMGLGGLGVALRFRRTPTTVAAWQNARLRAARPPT